MQNDPVTVISFDVPAYGDGAIALVPSDSVPERGNPIGLKQLLPVALPFNDTLSGFIEAPGIKSYTIILSSAFHMQIVGISTNVAVGSLTGHLIINDRDNTYPLLFEAITSINTFQFWEAEVLRKSSVKLVVDTIISPVDFSFTLFFEKILK